jgi:aryl carrier-like protein
LGLPSEALAKEGTTRSTPSADTGRALASADTPQDELEKAVAEIWSAALGLSPLGRADNFLDLGGHSLLAMRIVAQIRTAYQIDFTLRKFFENPTVAQMAAVIQAEIMAEVEALSDDEATERAL